MDGVPHLQVLRVTPVTRSTIRSRCSRLNSSPGAADSEYAVHGDDDKGCRQDRECYGHVRSPDCPTDARRSRHGDDDLALVITGTKTPKRFRYIGEFVLPVDHRNQLPGFEELIHVAEVLVGFQPDDTQVLFVKQ